MINADLYGSVFKTLRKLASYYRRRHLVRHQPEVIPETSLQIH